MYPSWILNEMKVNENNKSILRAARVLYYYFYRVRVDSANKTNTELNNLLRRNCFIIIYIQCS